MDAKLRMEIEWQCVQLSHAFSNYMDHRNYEALASLFTPDGIFLRHGEVLKGREQIVKKLHTRPANQFTRHVTTGFHFTSVEEAAASAEMYNISYFSHDAAVLPARFVPEQVLILDFNDQYAKTNEGWRIARRDTNVIFIPDMLRH